MKSSPKIKSSLSQPLPPQHQLPANATPDQVLGEALERLIRTRAYELYEERGRRDGSSERDWLEAEQEILRSLTRSAA
jgi:hypothetical protein